MKKTLLILGCALALFSCNQPAAKNDFKTAYVDTQKLVDESQEIKDLDARRKIKQDEMERELDEKGKQLQLDAASFQSEARVKGQQWAQMKYQDLQKRQNDLRMLQDSMLKQLQDEFVPKNDSIVKKIKDHIKEYGKKNGYDYIYGTGDAATVLYAKDEYDITKDIIKELNEKYSKAAGKTETATEEKDTTAADNK